MASTRRVLRLALLSVGRGPSQAAQVVSIGSSQTELDRSVSSSCEVGGKW